MLLKKFMLLILISCAAFSTLQAQDKKTNEKLLRHVVLFKFKESSSAAEIQKVVDAFAGLPKQVSVIKAFEWGINKSPENFHQGFTHCFILSFASEKDRDEIYQVHPAHKAFQDVLLPHMEKVFVVDYWVR